MAMPQTISLDLLVYIVICLTCIHCNLPDPVEYVPAVHRLQTKAPAGRNIQLIYHTHSSKSNAPLAGIDYLSLDYSILLSTCQTLFPIFTSSSIFLF
jgi:hypothetical protein